MIFQILRTVLIGAVVYFFSKLARSLIDQKIDPPHVQDQYDRPPTDGGPAKLVPCTHCNIYYNPKHPPECGKEDCPLKSGE